MSAPAWHVLRAPRPVHATDLGAGAPLAARALYAALAWCAPEILADVRSGHENSRRVRLALAQYETSRNGVRLTRTEATRGAAYLRALHAEKGGIL